MSGVASYAKASLGGAWHGVARRGEAWQAGAGLGTARRWRGMASFGALRRGAAGQGKEQRTQQITPRCARPSLGWARQGGVWHGVARHGKAWQQLLNRGEQCPLRQQ